MAPVRNALIDESFVSFGAGDRDVLLLVQHLGGITRAHDRRNSKLPADDGCMGRAPSPDEANRVLKVMAENGLARERSM